MFGHKLRFTRPGQLEAYAIAVSFATYFCMYAFRKPFAAAEYEGLPFLISGRTFELKTVFVVSQIVGYALSKVIGIRLCSEISPGRRAATLLGLIVAAQLALLLFAVLPNDWKVVAIFLNGLPLGMVWGLVVWYLEGRRSSELLLAGLSCSFIVASAIVKDIGVRIIDLGVPEFWMPFVTGLLFFIPYVISVCLLNMLPEPSEEDKLARVERTPMTGHDRWQFVIKFAPGLVMLMVVYFVLTAYRDYRDNFGVEIFAALGYAETPAKFTRTEIWVMFGVMAALAGLNLIRDNRWGLVGAFGIMASGALMLGAGTILLDGGYINGLTWMVLTGLGSYLAYVPFGSVLFDRLIASTRTTGTAVFAIYVADAIGYAGAISVMLGKDVIGADITRLDFFRYLTYFMAVLGSLLLVASCIYFLLGHRHYPQATRNVDTETSNG